MTSTPSIGLADYVSQSVDRQIFEIVKRTIDYVPTDTDQSSLYPISDTPIVPRDVFSVIYSASISNPPTTDEGNPDYGLAGAGFTLDLSRGTHNDVDYGDPSLSNYLPTYSSFGDFEFVTFPQEANSYFQDSYSADLYQSTSPSNDTSLDYSLVYGSLGGAFPSVDQPIDVPILDFSPYRDVPTNLNHGVMGLSATQALPRATAVSLVEFSDTGDYPSLIGDPQTGIGVFANDISSSDNDFIHFIVPDNTEVTNFILEDYIGPRVDNIGGEFGTISFSQGIDFSSDQIVFSADFGDSIDPLVNIKGFNLLADSGFVFGPGVYTAMISHTGDGQFELPLLSSNPNDSTQSETFLDRAYQFSYSPTRDFDIVFPLDVNNFYLDDSNSPLTFVEDDQNVIIQLPFSTADELPLALSWSSLGVLPGTLKIVEPDLPSDPYVLSGSLPLNFNGDLAISLKAELSDEGASKPVSFSIKVSPENDAPVITESTNNLFSVQEDNDIVITYDDLYSKFIATDVDSIASLSYKLQNFDATHSDFINFSSEVQLVGDVFSPSNGIILNPGDSFTWSPKSDFSDDINSVDLFSISATDGFIESSSILVQGLVSSVNDAPSVVSPTDAFVVNEDSLFTVQLQASDVDNDSSELLFELVDPTSHPEISLSSTGFLSIDGFREEFQSLNLTGIPSNSKNNIEFLVTDSGLSSDSSVGSFNIDFFGVNDKPIVENISSFLEGAEEDVLYTFSFDSLVNAAGVTDIDNDFSGVGADGNADYLRLFISNIPDNSSPILTDGYNNVVRALNTGDSIFRDDHIQWLPPSNQNGSIPVLSFSVFDSNGLESDITSSFSVNVEAVDDSPTINDSQLNTSLQLPENSPFSKQYLSTDVDGDSVSWSVTGIDKDFFQIDQSGLLNLINLPDFESKNNFNVSVNITDDTPASLSDSSLLSLDITNEFERQTLSLSSPVHIPGSGNVLKSDLSFSQDLAIKADFSSEIFFDPSSIRLDINSSDLSHFDSFQLDSGLLLLQTSDSSALSLDSGHLSFYAINPDDAGPFTLDLKQVSDSRIAPISDSKVIISSKADSFVDSTGHLDLSGFSAPLRILGGSLKVDKQAEIISQGDFQMPYGDSPYTVNSVSATSFDDELFAFEDLLSFSLKDGDDKFTINSSLRNDIVGSLGHGRDSVHVDISSLNGKSLTINDFELGLDKLVTTSVLNSDLKHRSDLFSSGLLEELGDVDIDLKISSFVKSIASSKLSSGELVPSSLPSQFLIGKSPIINSNIVIEPGDQGRTLVVQLLTQSESSSFSLLGENTPSSSFVRDDWEIFSSNGSTLYISYIGDTPVGSAIQDISGLRQLLGSISVQSSSEINFDVSFQWMSSSYASDSTAGLLENSGSDNDHLLTSAVSLSELSGVSPNSLSLVSDHSTSLAASVRINIAPEDGSVFQASNQDDHVSLLGEALRSEGENFTDSSDIQTSHVYGFDGKDTLIASDGSRIVGGLDHDILIAQRGSGTTQMVGGSGDDLLIGGSNDSLIGGIGADYLAVRGQGNRLIGGSGSDTFLVYENIFEYSDEGGRGLNRVLDFSSNDKIAFIDSSTKLFDPVHTSFGLEDTTAGLKIIFNDRDVALLQGISSADVNENQFIIDSHGNSASNQLSIFRGSQDIVSQISLLDQSV